MQPARKRSVFAALSLIGLAAGVIPFAGCQTAPFDANVPSTPARTSIPASLPASQQLMIKLKIASRSCNASDISVLAAATGEALTFLRPMSGNACVVSHAAKDNTFLRSGLQRLKSYDAVEWAEVDAIFKPL